jgi:hypothetical protein
MGYHGLPEEAGMRVVVVPIVSVFLLLVSACSVDKPPTPAQRSIDPPAAPGSNASNLTTGNDGRVYLSWIEPTDGSAHRLRFTVWDDDRWASAKTIATGEDWFVNWADFPAIAALADGTLAANWLVRSADSTYAYDVHVAVSTDGGNHWTKPVIAHGDGTPTEHGFVSLLPMDDDTFHVVWLDGRDTSGDGHGSGSMTLRAATLDRDGRMGAETLIDPRVCDCCQTDTALTAEGTLVLVYRDRSAEEVRDISIVRLEGDRWSEPAALHRDDWLMPACPVNGPAIDSRGDQVACAWFTAADGNGRVQLAFSVDDGRSFGPPIRVGGDHPVGRVDLLVMDDGSAIVSWLEQSQVTIQRIAPSGAAGQTHVIASTSDDRASGFPRMAQFDGQIFVTWTEPGEDSHVRAAVLQRPAAPY